VLSGLADILAERYVPSIEMPDVRTLEGYSFRAALDGESPLLDLEGSSFTATLRGVGPGAILVGEAPARRTLRGKGA
jgi:hypothetical protein